MKKNVGRPPKNPETPFVTLTLRISSESKSMLIKQAQAYDMTLTEYLLTLVARDGA